MSVGVFPTLLICFHCVHLFVFNISQIQLLSQVLAEFVKTIYISSVKTDCMMPSKQIFGANIQLHSELQISHNIIGDTGVQTVESAKGYS